MDLRHIRLPRIPKREVQFLTLDEIQQYLFGLGRVRLIWTGSASGHSSKCSSALARGYRKHCRCSAPPSTCRLARRRSSAKATKSEELLNEAVQSSFMLPPCLVPSDVALSSGANTPGKRPRVWVVLERCRSSFLPIHSCCAAQRETGVRDCGRADPGHEGV
jgi:hypothetical protein